MRGHVVVVLVYSTENFRYVSDVKVFTSLRVAEAFMKGKDTQHFTKELI